MIDRSCDTWKDVKAFCRSELEKLTGALEQDHEIKDTTIMRGQVKALRSVLALVPEEPVIVGIADGLDAYLGRQGR